MIIYYEGRVYIDVYYIPVGCTEKRSYILCSRESRISFVKDLINRIESIGSNKICFTHQGRHIYLCGDRADE